MRVNSHRGNTVATKDGDLGGRVNAATPGILLAVAGYFAWGFFRYFVWAVGGASDRIKYVDGRDKPGHDDLGGDWSYENA
jgi:hypothetical protein